jgi:pimeloyl-ACP methyl ester carboxylesterase
MLEGVMVTQVAESVRAGYRAPYPDPALTIGSRAFTQQLPTRPDNPMLAGGGHFLQEDIPDAYNRALLAWLTTNVGR